MSVETARAGPRIPRHWLSLLGLALASRLSVAVVALLVHGGSPSIPGASGRQWFQWDTLHYVFIAANGYAQGADGGNVIVWFPLYPTLVRLVSFTGLDLRLATLVVSTVSSVAATVVLYELARLDHDDTTAWRAAAWWNIFPTAYFLFAGYTEGLFCLLAFGCVLAARRRRWLLVAVLGALATATRINGLALVPYVGAEIAMMGPALGALVEPLIALLAVPLGFFAFLLLNLKVYGDPLAFTQIDRDHFHKELAPPWAGARGAWNLFYGGEGWGRLTIGLAELLGGITFYIVAILSAIKLRWSDAAYTVATLFVVTFTTFWLSEPRYLLSLYPMFLLLGRIRGPRIQTALAMLSIAAMWRLAAAFTGGVWAF